MIPMCSFAASRVSSEHSRTATIGFAGNAMHTHCAGIALLFALTQIETHHQSNHTSGGEDLALLAAAIEADFFC